MHAALRMWAIWVTASAGLAQFSSNFEFPIYASVQKLTGQEGWTLALNSEDYFVYRYDFPPFGIPPNPAGGQQFVAGASMPAKLARAQRDVPFALGNRFVIGYDVLVRYLGALPAAERAGSFSMQPFVEQFAVIAGFNQVAVFTDPSTALHWNASYTIYDEAGFQVIGVGPTPGPAFENLHVNRWYHITTTIDFSTNRIVNVTIGDPGARTFACAQPENWYLGGGAAGGLPRPHAIRLFSGGFSLVGDMLMAWDNVEIAPAAPPCPVDLDGDGSTTQNDLNVLLAAFGTQPGDANYNPEAGALSPPAGVDQLDLNVLLSELGCGCQEG